jgi:DNA primase large subunit
MNVKQRQQQNEVVDHSKNLKYPFRLSFYERPPLDDVTIEDFEIFAIDRLRGPL